MFKKIALGVLLTGLVAALTVGAVIRTNAKSGEGAGETGRRGRITEYASPDASTQGGRGGRWGQGGASEQAPAAAESLPQADVQPDEWSTVEGTVVSAAEDLVEIETASGEIIPFEGRPLSYALEQGFSLKARDAVALEGFDEDGAFKIGKVTKLDSHASISLRDASGRPAWAGRGRQG